MKQIFKALLLITLVTLTACKKTTPVTEEEGFDYGTVTDNKYTNKYFNIEMDVPEGWAVQSQEQREAIMKQGAEAVIDDSNKAKAILKASEITSANLLIVFRDPVGTTEDYNPNFILVAENLKNAPKIKSASDYLINCKKVLAMTKLDIISMDDTFEEKKINGFDFRIMNVTTNMNNHVLLQKYCTTVKDNFAISFICSYTDEAQKMTLEKTLKSIAAYKR